MSLWHLQCTYVPPNTAPTILLPLVRTRRSIGNLEKHSLFVRVATFASVLVPKNVFPKFTQVAAMFPLIPTFNCVEQPEQYPPASQYQFNLNMTTAMQLCKLCRHL